jgi:hypothetical protein
MDWLIRVALITLNQKKITLYTFTVIPTSCMPQRGRATTVTLCSMLSFETTTSKFPASFTLSSSSSTGTFPHQEPLLPQYLVRSNHFRSYLQRKWNQPALVYYVAHLLEVAFDSNCLDEVVFRLRLKVLDGASETPVFVHCTPPTQLWQ